MTNHDPDETPPNSEVGYKRPPKHSQFVKGKSGNPKGRPKLPTEIDIKAIFDEKLTTTNGKLVSNGELLIRRLLQDARNGNQKAFAQFLKYLKLCGLIAKPKRRGPNIIYFEPGPVPSPETYEAWKRENGKL